jgi:hypothetical protein
MQKTPNSNQHPSSVPSCGFTKMLPKFRHTAQADGGYRGALQVIAGTKLVSVVLPLIVSPPHRTGEAVRSPHPRQLPAPEIRTGLSDAPCRNIRLRD